MTIVDKIKEIAISLPGAPAFSYMGKYEHNANDSLDYSQSRVNLLEIEQPGFVLSPAGTLRRRYPVFIEFIKMADPDLTAEQRAGIVEEMLMLAERFIAAVSISDIDIVGDTIQGITIINRYDQNVVGYELNIILLVGMPNTLC